MKYYKLKQFPKLININKIKEENEYNRDLFKIENKEKINKLFENNYIKTLELWRNNNFKDFYKFMPLYYEVIDNITVIRDDYLFGGTKSRFVMDMIHYYYTQEGRKTFVYNTPFYGGAQIALAVGCFLYNKYVLKDNIIKIILVIEYSDYEYPFVRVVKDLINCGANVEYVQQNIYSNDYFIIPSGFDVKIVQSQIQEFGNIILEKMGRKNLLNDNFDEFFYTCGSGTLLRNIQKSNLAKVYNSVAVTGGIPELGDNGKCIGNHYKKYEELVDDDKKPPFNSAIHYDAKGWEFIKNKNNNVLFWNVL